MIFIDIHSKQKVWQRGKQEITIKPEFREKTQNIIAKQQQRNQIKQLISYLMTKG